MGGRPWENTDPSKRKSKNAKKYAEEKARNLRYLHQILRAKCNACCKLPGRKKNPITICNDCKENMTMFLHESCFPVGNGCNDCEGKDGHVTPYADLFYVLKSTEKWPEDMWEETTKELKSKLSLPLPLGSLTKDAVLQIV